MKDKIWRGWLKVHPLNPDTILARYMNWSPGGRMGYATSSYPEPNNISAASAWTVLKPEMIPEDGIVYRDNRTGMWIVAVDVRHVAKDKAEDWAMEQARKGAVAFWINEQVADTRPQMPMEELMDPDTVFERRGRKKGCITTQSCKPIVTPKGVFASKKLAHTAHHMSLITLNKMMQRQPELYYHISMDEYKQLLNTVDTQVS
jgi:hypothetical protein